MEDMTIAQTMLRNYFDVDKDGRWYIKDIDLFRDIVAKMSCARGRMEFGGPQMLVFEDGSTLEFETE